MNEDKLGDAVVLVFANTLTPSTGTRLGKIMTDVPKCGDLGWWYGATVMSPLQADKGRGRGREKGKKAGGGDVPPRAK